MKHKQRRPLPLELAREFAKVYPKCWEHVEYLREGKGNDLPDWNDLVYIPITGINEIMRAKYNKDVGAAEDSSLYAALAAWRQYKEIYSFSDELRDILYEQSGEDIVIPIDILYQMPYPCIYITENENQGVFVFFEQDMNTMEMELRFAHVEVENGHVDTLDTWVHLVPGYTISQGIAKGMEIVKQNVKTTPSLLRNLAEFAVQNEQAMINYYYSMVSKYIQLVLYICAENAEVEENPIQKQITRKPQDNRPKDVFREIRNWDVGVKFAKNIRKSRQQSAETERHYSGPGAPKRPHTRRGHWHHYWVGSDKDNSRKLILKWTAPMFIGGDSDNTIATVNKIE